MKYEVKKVGESWKVWNNINKVFITNDVPFEEIANEICEDFNAMDNKDYRPLGLPNFSKKK